MTASAAVTLYIGLSVLLLVLLKLNVGRVRVRDKVVFGDGANEPLQRAIRVQGNAVEDVPIVLLGLIGLAMLSAPVWLIHVLGVGLLVSRIAHAVGLSGTSASSAGRMYGTIGTTLVMLVTAGACVWFALI